MTRKKIGTGLAEAFTVPCETCSGRGYHVHDAVSYTHLDAADERSSVDLGGRRIIKKKTHSHRLGR